MGVLAGFSLSHQTHSSGGFQDLLQYITVDQLQEIKNQTLKACTLLLEQNTVNATVNA